MMADRARFAYSENVDVWLCEYAQSESGLLENWDDYRFLLAVMEEGSLSAAARRLDVNHATVLRRVASFEERMGLSLFDRSASGYRLRGDRRAARNALRQLEEAVAASERAVVGQGTGLSGPIRITSTDSLCCEVLPEIVAGIASAHPALRLELISTNRHLDLGRLDAELTVRPAKTLSAPLVGEVAARMGFRVFGLRDGHSDIWLKGTGTLSGAPPAAWIAGHIDEQKIGGSADSYMTMRAMILAGQGISYLPVRLAHDEHRLVQRDDLGPPLETRVWVAHHEDLLGVERIATCRALLVDGLGAVGHQLAGAS